MNEEGDKLFGEKEELATYLPVSRALVGVKPSVCNVA